MNGAELKTYLKGNNRLCPNPPQWAKLSQLLREWSGGEDSIPFPLILSNWYITSEQEKHMRFEEQIDWAEQYGILDKVIDFIDSLDAKDWHFKSIKSKPVRK